jgi:hypothetical protein
MDAETAVPARNRTAVVAILVAAAALGAFALVGTGVLLGWIPRGAVPDAPAPVNAPPPNAATAKAPSTGLPKFSGSEPLMPRYSQPNAPPPAPAQSFQETTRPAWPKALPPPAPLPASPAPSEPQPDRFASEDPVGPVPPTFGRAEPRPAPGLSAKRRGTCEECGRVIGIAHWRSGWEMRVRFDDGSTQTFRFRRRPPFDLGERVRLDGDELVSD